MYAIRSYYAFPLYGRFGVVRQRWGNWDTQLCVHGIILCGKSDFPDAQNPQDKHDARYVMVSAFNDPDFKELCDITGLKDLYGKYKAHNRITSYNVCYTKLLRAFILVGKL